MRNNWPHGTTLWQKTTQPCQYLCNMDPNRRDRSPSLSEKPMMRQRKFYKNVEITTKRTNKIDNKRENKKNTQQFTRMEYHHREMTHPHLQHHQNHPIHLKWEKRQILHTCSERNSTFETEQLRTFGITPDTYTRLKKAKHSETSNSTKML
jgi:hypothetical protein